MIKQSFLDIILSNFPHIPTSNQRDALSLIANFLMAKEEGKVFILSGFAGTGKTSLIGALVKSMTMLRQKTVLLAPTGRAAKVFSLYAMQNAYTIHKKIYRQKSIASENAAFQLAQNKNKDTLFIVDEASMISNSASQDCVFGSGRLLDDLVMYIYSGSNCRLILMGDSAQLPPVMQMESLALSSDYISGYSLEVSECLLSQVVRQTNESGILFNATRIRTYLTNISSLALFPGLRFANFADFRSIVGSELIEHIEEAYSADGQEETMIICRSNKRAVAYNKGIRNTILYREEELSSGDRLMISKNNYFWMQDYEEIDFIANGEIAQIIKVYREESLYGFRFADVLLRFDDYDAESTVKIMLDVLHTHAPAMTQEMNNQLFQSILEDYNHLRRKSEKYKALKSDPYFNALQPKYAYAVTCHKAQGGQWKNVFIDIGYTTQETQDEDFFRWLYTAITRATKTVYFVNLPSTLKDK